MPEWAVWYPAGDGEGVVSISIPGEIEDVMEIVQDDPEVIAVARAGVVPVEVTQYYDCGWGIAGG